MEHICEKLIRLPKYQIPKVKDFMNRLTKKDMVLKPLYYHQA